MRTRQFLESLEVPFEMMQRQPTYEASHLGDPVAVIEENIAKTVILNVDDSLALAVLPVTHLIDLTRVKEILHAERVELPTEKQFNDRLPGFEVGAVPPFGREYGMTTLVDTGLVSGPEKGGDIIFEGNTQDEVIRMGFDDYQSVESPLLASFAYQS